jgi:hypothetical protein
MPMIIYTPTLANEVQFVEFWRFRYAYGAENLYAENIGEELTEERIWSLFRWKNGTPLSDAKWTTVRNNFVNRRHELAQIQPNITATDFLNHFHGGGAIWRIFWLHCWRPERFPIYDRHVHRAMEFIERDVVEEIPKHHPTVIRSYVERYLPFHARFNGMDSRDVDKALWAYGKFLKESNFPTI